MSATWRLQLDQREKDLQNRQGQPGTLAQAPLGPEWGLQGQVPLPAREIAAPRSQLVGDRHLSQPYGQAWGETAQRQLLNQGGNQQWVGYGQGQNLANTGWTHPADGSGVTQTGWGSGVDGQSLAKAPLGQGEPQNQAKALPSQRLGQTQPLATGNSLQGTQTVQWSQLDQMGQTKNWDQTREMPPRQTMTQTQPHQPLATNQGPYNRWEPTQPARIGQVGSKQAYANPLGAPGHNQGIPLSTEPLAGRIAQPQPQQVGQPLQTEQGHQLGQRFMANHPGQPRPSQHPLPPKNELTSTENLIQSGVRPDDLHPAVKLEEQHLAQHLQGQDLNPTVSRLHNHLVGSQQAEQLQQQHITQREKQINYQHEANQSQIQNQSHTHLLDQMKLQQTQTNQAPQVSRHQFSSHGARNIGGGNTSSNIGGSSNVRVGNSSGGAGRGGVDSQALNPNQQMHYHDMSHRAPGKTQPVVRNLGPAQARF